MPSCFLLFYYYYNKQSDLRILLELKYIAYRSFTARTFFVFIVPCDIVYAYALVRRHPPLQRIYWSCDIILRTGCPS
jgi:hypothetical protein